MKRVGLGSKEGHLLTVLSERGESVFSTSRAAEILSGSLNAARKLLFSLVRKGWLIRLKEGLYLIVPLEAGPESVYSEHEFIIASHLATRYYIGFWSALNFHGFTEQTPYTVFVASPKAVRNREVLGVKYRFVHVADKRMFGFREYPIANSRVNVSDKEKTIVDCLANPGLCGGLVEPMKPLVAGEKLDYELLTDYATRTGGAALKRTGFLLEKLGLYTLPPKVNKGYVYLDPAGPKTGKSNSRWGIIENISVEDARKELET